MLMVFVHFQVSIQLRIHSNAAPFQWQLKIKHFEIDLCTFLFETIIQPMLRDVFNYILLMGIVMPNTKGQELNLLVALRKMCSAFHSKWHFRCSSCTSTTLWFNQNWTHMQPIHRSHIDDSMRTFSCGWKSYRFSTKKHFFIKTRLAFI